MIAIVDHIEDSPSDLIYLVEHIRDLPEGILTSRELEKQKKTKELSFQAGKVHEKVWVVDFSKMEKGTTEEDVRKSAAAVAKALNLKALVQCEILKDSVDYFSFLEGFLLAQYTFHQLKSQGENIERFLQIKGAEDSKLEELKKLVKYVCWSRDLVNFPLSHLNAEDLTSKIATEAEELGCGVEQLGKKQIESLKMGGLLAVNRGSEDPPSLLLATWKPDHAINKKPIVFVGKGIVYDTGGLSLKPTPNSMDMMKSDMAGAAAVSGAFLMAAAMKLPVYIELIVPATDNRPGKNAYVPGDVITQHDGTTVEVLNTDAEGRLILADGVSFAKKYDPSVILTAATLTGASLRATGHYAATVMGNGESDVELLVQSGWKTGEKLIQAPFWDEYKDELKSDIADLKNIGGAYAGHITAGKFLEHFASAPFVHLDIASTAFLPKATGYQPKGGTGFGVRLLYRFLQMRSEQS